LPVALSLLTPYTLRKKGSPAFQKIGIVVQGYVKPEKPLKVLATLKIL
jgi:hypothetical protein